MEAKFLESSKSTVVERENRVANAGHTSAKKFQYIPIVKQGDILSVYVDVKGKDYEGLALVAQSFAQDVNMVTGVTPTITTDMEQLDDTVLIAGSIGNNDFIDALIAQGKINVSAIKNKWEAYQIQVIEKPKIGIDRAIVIVGSDKRGTMYGIYHISQLIGVSPWVYWGDVIPKKQPELEVLESELHFTSKEPSVKYRGIFLNDEWPSLGTWVSHTFGDFNEELYKQVFELILRLKGNFLWPAMWSAIFSENGKSSSIANAKLADTYGIVVGASHHEPMHRAGEEWQKMYQQYGTSNLWDFSKNKEAITKFWEDGIIRNKDFENLVTLGMRGERDSSLEGGMKENIELLKNIIHTQKDLLKKHGSHDSLQVFNIYKEVEYYWHGTNTVKGLKEWDVLDDVTIMLAEDNFGNVRSLPTEETRNREAGWGMYYHFDYHGGPHSYEWVNTTPIEKTWEQMSMAYDYGVREVWVVNVGDLKPMEFPISYFMDLAYDFEKWGTNGINKTLEYTKQWVTQQFKSVTDKEVIDGIANVLSDYTRMNGTRKPESTYSWIYSYTNYREGERVLAQATQLENNAKKYGELIPENDKDVYYQLVYYPAVASANVKKMQIYAGFNELYYQRKSVLANKYAALVQEAIITDEEMQNYYNNEMSGGKWKGMMSSPHIGYVTWNADGWKYPDINNVTPKGGSFMIVDVEGTEKEYVSGVAELPIFTNLLKETYSITISNGGNTIFNYKVEVDADWIKIDKAQGSVQDGTTVQVSIDWNRLLKTSSGAIFISGAGEIVKVNITAEVIDTQDLPEMTFVETHNVIAIEAEHTSNRVASSNAEWKVIENYGRSLSSLKMFPTTVSFEKVEDAPYVEYKMYVNGDATYTLTTYVAPTNNLSVESRLRYGVSFDGETPTIADTLPMDFDAGNHDNDHWNNGVLDNIRTTTTTHQLKKGIHTLRFSGLDAGLVLQKLALSKGTLPNSYFGPEESFYKGLAE